MRFSYEQQLRRNTDKKKNKQLRRNKFLRFLIQNEVVKLSIMDKIKENSTSPHEKISKEGRKRNKYK